MSKGKLNLLPIPSLKRIGLSFSFDGGAALEASAAAGGGTGVVTGKAAAASACKPDSNLMRLKALIDVSSESDCRFSVVSSSPKSPASWKILGLLASLRSRVLMCLEIFKSSLRCLLTPSNHTLHSEL